MKLTTIPCLFLFLIHLHVAVQAETVVIVNPKNPVNILSSEDAIKLFLAKTSDFPGGIAAMPVNLPDGNPVRNTFYTQYSRKDAAQLKSYWARLVFTGKAFPPKELASEADIKKFVANTIGAIGYIDKQLVDDSVKVVMASQP
jgi:ABC-type phosphate transport system substrate-binding protein